MDTQGDEQLGSALECCAKDAEQGVRDGASAPDASTPRGVDDIEVTPGATLSGVWRDLLVHADERKGRSWAIYALLLASTVLLSSGFHMMVLWRMGAFFNKLHLAPFRIIIEKMIFHGYHCVMPCTVSIGPGLWVPHPLGIVLASRTTLGAGVWLRQHVQIIHVWEPGKEGVVGDRARLNTGAILIGGALIGEDSVVAAGAVATKPAPPRSLVIGMPAQIRPLRPDQMPQSRARYK